MEIGDVVVVDKIVTFLVVMVVKIFLRTSFLVGFRGDWDCRLTASYPTCENYQIVLQRLATRSLCMS